MHSGPGVLSAAQMVPEGGGGEDEAEIDDERVGGEAPEDEDEEHSPLRPRQLNGAEVAEAEAEAEEEEEEKEERRRPSAGAGLRVEHSEAGGTHAASGVGSALMSWLGLGSVVGGKGQGRGQG